MQNNSQQSIVSAIIIAGVLIAGAILLKGNSPQQTPPAGTTLKAITLAPVNTEDRVLGNSQAKITMFLYEDYQCPFCGKFFSESETPIRDTYVKNGDIQLVYRDFPFLGTFVKPYVENNDESIHSAEAARCAADQGKFWEYHDYLLSHQNGENQGNFSIVNLKSFAKDLGLNTSTFSECIDSVKYQQAILDSKAEASTAGVTGTPKGFIVTKKDISKTTQDEIFKALNISPNDQQPPISFYITKNIISLNGALPFNMIKTIVDILLK